MSKKAIDGVSDMLEAMTRIALGKMDELPDRVRRVPDDYALAIIACY